MKYPGVNFAYRLYVMNLTATIMIEYHTEYHDYEKGKRNHELGLYGIIV